MIQPEDIRRKAENLYRDCLQAWLAGDESFFPRLIPARKTPDLDNLAAGIEAVRRLREGSREVRGFGYTVVWREVHSRKLGRNTLPAQVLFETREDYLRFLGKQREFTAFTDAVTRLRATFPALEGWLRSNISTLIEAAPDLECLLSVVQFLRDHPRPNLFARELPIPADTKFIERHQRLLRQWLDIVLPAHAIRADEDHFERRYGLRYPEPHLHVRLLDVQLQHDLGFPCPEFSLPLHTLASLSAKPAAVFIVENKVNLLTLPPLPGTLGLGALGHGVTLLRHVPWLEAIPIVYWGDLDVQGFVILSSLRAIFPQTSSILMDDCVLERWQHLCTPGTGVTSELPAHLTDAERAACLRCREENLRLEQERLPKEVLAGLEDWGNTLFGGTSANPRTAELSPEG
jgi:hypothetical protein